MEGDERVRRLQIGRPSRFTPGRRRGPTCRWRPAERADFLSGQRGRGRELRRLHRSDRPAPGRGGDGSAPTPFVFLAPSAPARPCHLAFCRKRGLAADGLELTQTAEWTTAGGSRRSRSASPCRQIRRGARRPDMRLGSARSRLTSSILRLQGHREVAVISLHRRADERDLAIMGKPAEADASRGPSSGCGARTRRRPTSACSASRMESTPRRRKARISCGEGPARTDRGAARCWGAGPADPARRHVTARQNISSASSAGRHRGDARRLNAAG